MRIPNIPHRHIGDHVYTSRITRRALIVVAVTVLALVVVATVASLAAADTRRPVPTMPAPSHTSVRCSVLEHYRTGNLLGCSDGSLRFEPRGRRG
jgi:hypothetical protein